MKKQLIEAIKAKFVGIDEGTAKRLAERAIAKSENGISSEDEVKVAVEAITLADVLKSVNDFSADDAIKKYEEKYSLKNGEKKSKTETDEDKDKDKDKGKGDEDKDKDKSDKDKSQSDELKALLKEFKDGFANEMKSLKDELSAMKSGKISENRRSKLDAILKDLKDFQKKPYGRIDLGKMSDDEFESFITEVKEEVGDMIAENRASESHVSPLFGGNNRQNNQNNNGNVKEASKDELDALMGKFNFPNAEKKS